MKNWVFAKPARLRRLLNLWPPFLFTGIRITELSDDFRHCRVVLKNWPGTRNANGTQFGGSLFAMTDPIYSLMLMGLLGDKYFIWDKSAHIDFIRPGRGKVFFNCTISDDFLRAVRENTAGGGKYFPELHTLLTDSKGETVAEVNRTLYIRLKPAFRPPENDSCLS
ncbi:DUF4442 domain-containing protein [Uruburuella testudinis]|uniref:DUF4442 domain-containing protein n=1 Tax=Uruburuella testudinis TaxID=1282863 RepID=A0ABY4DPY3_9NEIS|nr:DUF4442 domain-containing protein [Uruburuella testudinis]UOO80775.1 DUF4442 domain-containing protein [Uruburuella testudinis]